MFAMTMATKQEIFEKYKTEYFKASRKRKGEILDAITEVSGLTRKGAIKHLPRIQLRDPASTETRGRPRKYTTDVIAALKEVWEIGAEACGENLHPMIGEYIDIEQREKNWRHPGNIHRGFPSVLL